MTSPRANQRDDDGNSIMTPVVDFLERQPGLPFCALCLAHATGLRTAEARQVLDRLPPPRFSKAQRRCVRCFRDEVVVYANG